LQSFRILIRASNWLGDSVISVPAVRAMKASRPEAHITVAAPKKIAALWKLVPEVDEIIPIAHRRLFSTVRALRKQACFDVALLFPNSPRVALETWLAGVPRRVGYRGHFRSWLLTEIVSKPAKASPPKHQAFHYLRIAQALDPNRGDPNVEAPTVNLPPSVLPQTSHLEPQTLIGLCPGAEYGPAKRWLPERFAEAAKLIAGPHEVKWILFGTKRDAAAGEMICGSLGDSCVNRIGKTTIDQLIDELRQCRLLLTNDTGTMHLASLIGVPAVAIFGSTEPRLTGPLGEAHIVLRHQVECSPCFLRDCPIDFRCMKAVSVQEVVTAVLSILTRSTSSPGGRAQP
jgi:lipopolysaccharide heptosyltransferase II